MRYFGNLSQFRVQVGNNIIEIELDIFIFIDQDIVTAILKNSNHGATNEIWQNPFEEEFFHVAYMQLFY